MDLARTGPLRFDPTRRATSDFPTGLNGSLDPPTVLAIGGVEADYTKPQTGSASTGTGHHRGSLYATGATAALAPAGAQGPEVWEPPPGWGKDRGALRRPRVLLVIPQLRFGDGIIQAADCRAQIPALAAALAPRGVTVVLSRNPLHNMRPLAAAVPVKSLAYRREPFQAPIDVPIVKLDPVYHTGLCGGDIMVVELNACKFLYGGIPGIGHPEFDAGYTFEFIDAFQASTPHPNFPGGTKYEFTNNPTYSYSPVDGHPISLWDSFGKPYVFSCPRDAAADRAAAGALAARCHAYRHQVYQLDRWFPVPGDPLEASGPMNDGALFAELYGGADWVRNRVVTPTAGAVWGQIRSDAVAFFSA